MTNKDVIRILRAYQRGNMEEDIPPHSFDLTDETVEHIIAALERDKWISAITPPDTHRFVLVMNDEGRCGVAQYVGDDIEPITPWQIAYCLYDVDTWDDKEQGPVCWWRELPEAPKEET